MSKLASHWPFGHLQPKLWAKEGPGLLAVWLLTTKSRKSTSFRRPMTVWDMAFRENTWENSNIWENSNNSSIFSRWKLEIIVCMIAWHKRLWIFLIGYMSRFHYYIIWKSLKMMKTCQLSIKQRAQQRGRKRYKMEGHKSWQAKDIPKRAYRKGNKKKSSTWTSPPQLWKAY